MPKPPGPIDLDAELRDHLWVVKSVLRRIDCDTGDEDILQAAQMGLLMAILHWRHDKGCFTAFADRAIRWSVHHQKRANVPWPGAEPLVGWEPAAPEPSDLPGIDAVMEAASGLPDVHRKLLDARFARSLTLAQVGAELGVTKERVRQIESVILHKLHASLAPGTRFAGRRLPDARRRESSAKPVFRDEAEPMGLLAGLYPPVTADTPCGDVMPRRTADLLAARSVNTLGEAAKLTATEMLRLQGFGRGRLAHVMSALGRAGLRPATTPGHDDPTSVWYLNLSLRAHRRLRQLRIKTVGQLVSTPSDDLLAGKGFGGASLAHIATELKRLGVLAPW